MNLFYMNYDMYYYVMYALLWVKPDVCVLPYTLSLDRINNTHQNNLCALPYALPSKAYGNK